jgi:hypothetical protein
MYCRPSFWPFYLLLNTSHAVLLHGSEEKIYFNKRNDFLLHQRLDLAREALARSHASNWQVLKQTLGTKNPPHNAMSVTLKKFHIKAKVKECSRLITPHGITLSYDISEQVF